VTLQDEAAMQAPASSSLAHCCIHFCNGNTLSAKPAGLLSNTALGERTAITPDRQRDKSEDV
jgi:hypothetical protein